MPKAFIIDLDGTLLHRKPSDIAVYGRSGPVYISYKSIALLYKISRLISVIIATGRNAKSVNKFISRLDNNIFTGFILENGLIARTALLEKRTGPDFGMEKYVVSKLKGWEKIPGYEKCIALIPPLWLKNPYEHIKRVAVLSGKSWHIYRENNKFFLFPFFPSKLAGIRALGIKPHIALGDGKNDMDMLREAEYPGTLASAHEDIKNLVKKKGGYCSAFASHEGTEDLLEWAYAILK